MSTRPTRSNRLLGTLRHDHVVGVRPDRSGDAHVPGDRRPETSMAARGSVSREPRGRPAKLLRQEATPCRKRKQGGIRHADAEIVDRWLRRAVGERRDGAPHVASMDDARWRALPLDAVERFSGDERSCADAADQRTLGHQALVRDAYRIPRDAQATRENPRGRQPLARTKAAIQDRLEQLPVNLNG
jgi:hypothetical protein